MGMTHDKNQLKELLTNYGKIDVLFGNEALGEFFLGFLNGRRHSEAESATAVYLYYHCFVLFPVFQLVEVRVEEFLGSGE
mgnify:CR=1 FL=1